MLGALLSLLAAVPRELADLSIFEAKEALEKAMFTARETKSRGNDAFRSGALENALAWYAEARRDLEAYAGLAVRLGDYDRRMAPATTKQAPATDELRDLRVDLLMNGVLCKLRQRQVTRRHPSSIHQLHFPRKRQYPTTSAATCNQPQTLRYPTTEKTFPHPHESAHPPCLHQQTAPPRNPR